MLVKIAYFILHEESHLLDYTGPIPEDVEKKLQKLVDRGFETLDSAIRVWRKIYGAKLSEEKSMWINPTVIKKVTYRDYTKSDNSNMDIKDKLRYGYESTHVGKIAILELTKDREIVIKVNSEDDIPKLLEQLGLKVRAVNLD